MAEWDDRFKGHAVHQALSALNELLESVRHLELPTEAHDPLARIASVAALTRRLLDACEPVLTSFNILNAVQKQIGQIHAELSNFSSNRDLGHLNNANTHVDALLDTLSRISPGRGDPSLQAVTEISSHFRESAEAMLQALQSEASELQGSASQTATSLAQGSARLDQLRGLIDQQQARLDQAVSDFQRQFSEAEDRRRQTFDTAGQKTAAEHAEALAAQKKSFEERLQAFDANGKKLLEQIAEKRQEATDLVHVIGNIGVTGNYKMEAGSERRSANVFRWIALLAMVLIVAGVASTLKVALQADAAWQQVFLRIGITIALAIPAAYAARESERHRRLERKYRRMELELSSIDTYLAKLPEATRHELKAKLAERFFGQSEEEGGSDRDDAVATSALDIVKLAIENLTKR